MQGYTEYKETGLAWLERIPSHWGLRRAKTLYKKEHRQPYSDDDVVTCFRDGQVTLRKNRRSTGYTEAIQEHGYQRVEIGDLVIHVMDAFAGAIGVSDSSGKCTPVYSVCSAKEDINNFYYAQILRIMACKGYIQSLYRGIRERSSDFRYEVFAQQLLPLPPREEQDKIVQFLDHKLEKIHKFIANKQKLIALLEEQKQAIINQAVTKGLDLNAPMKHSGIDWLGEVPKHWEVRKLRSLTKIRFQYGANESGIPYSDDLPRYIRITDIDMSGHLKNENMLSLPKDVAQPYILDEGDVLFARSGATVGKSFLFKKKYGESSFAGYLIKFKADKEKILPEFLYGFTQGTSYNLWINSIFIQATIQNISAEKYKNLQIPVPPITEQKKIISYIEEVTQKHDVIMEKTQKEIDLIQEYKTSLISSVVTGQVDV